LQALSRRAQPENAVTTLRVADLTLDLLKHKVTRAGANINLQPREFRLLEYLMRHAGQVVTRSMLLENVWDYHFDRLITLILKAALHVATTDQPAPVHLFRDITLSSHNGFQRTAK